MNTIEDFKNAPVGATATNPNGSVLVWKETETDDLPWVYITYDEWFSNEELAKMRYTLNPVAPTTAQEALNLAWELAHPVKEGQVIPAGTETIVRSGEILLMTPQRWDRVVEPGHVSTLRTLYPLPEQEPELPDWLDADAVVAFKDAVVDIWTHCISHPHDDGSGWTRRDPDSCTHWSELEHVTPLYPKETNK